jgi:hypothetical protein
MSKKINQFGLSRIIPSEVALEIRQNSGFGCVICGRAVTHFDHVDPEWHNAKSHDPSKMTQLCGYCHDLKTRGHLSVERIKKAMLKPKSFEDGFVIAPFNLCTILPNIKIGNSTFINADQIIKVDEKEILKFVVPIEQDDPVLLYADFCNENGERLFSIEGNKWSGDTANWDINVKGKNIILRQAKNEILIDIENDPDNNLIIIHRLNMFYKNWKFIGTKNSFEIISPDGNKFALTGDSFFECGTVFQAYSNPDGTFNLRIGVPKENMASSFIINSMRIKK